MNLRKIKTVEEFMVFVNILYGRLNNINTKISYEEQNCKINGNYKTVKAKIRNEYTLRSKIEDRLNCIDYAQEEVIVPERKKQSGKMIMYCFGRNYIIKDKHVEKIMELYLELINPNKKIVAYKDIL